MNTPTIAAATLALVLASAPSDAQTISGRGFVEGSAVGFPQEAPNDGAQRVGDLLIRGEAFVKPAPWVQFAAGLDVRANSHAQVEDRWRLDVDDRGIERPRLSVRRLTATLTRHGFTLDVGKQFIRWGKTDIVTPTDRFAPRDFLNVVDNEFLPVVGARGVAELGDDTVEVVWLPRFTPSRIPLINERWTAIPAVPAAVVANLSLVDRGGSMPQGAQEGVRWAHVGARFEYALAFFNGFNHLPDVDVVARPVAGGAMPPPLEIDVTRRYPALRTYGGDVAVPMKSLTVKAEGAYFTSSSPATDEYVLYVVQLERQVGEWVLVGGYAGEAVTHRRTALTFSPDRGMTRAIVARAAYTIDANRSVAVEGAAHQDGHGEYARVEYSQARGLHWRATVSAVAIGGSSGDFLGQYRRNSHAGIALRYSF